MTVAHSDIKETRHRTIVEFLCEYMASPRMDVFTVFGCSEIVIRERVEIDVKTENVKQWIEIQAWPNNDISLFSPGSQDSSAQAELRTLATKPLESSANADTCISDQRS